MASGRPTCAPIGSCRFRRSWLATTSATTKPPSRSAFQAAASFARAAPTSSRLGPSAARDRSPPMGSRPFTRASTASAMARRTRRSSGNPLHEPRGRSSSPVETRRLPIATSISRRLKTSSSKSTTERFRSARRERDSTCPVWEADMRTRLFGVLLFIHLAAGCGGSDSNGTPAEGVPGSAEDGNDAGMSQPGTPAAPSGDPTADGCAAAIDLPDDRGADTNCDGADGVVGRDVYVDFAGGSPTNPGTPAAPLKTLDGAIALAQSRGGHVLVLAGSTSLASLSKSGTWSVYGGYPKGFLGAPKRDSTILETDAGGLLVENADSALFAHLTIRGADVDMATQRTAHALRTKAKQLELIDVVVQAGNGKDGTGGASGAPGAAGIASNRPLGWGPNPGAHGLTCDGIATAAFTKIGRAH